MSNIVGNKLNVVKNIRNKTYLGHGNTVFAFKDLVLATNVYDFVQQKPVVSYQDEDTINKYKLMVDSKNKSFVPENKNVKTYQEDRDKLFTSLAIFDMNLVVVETLITNEAGDEIGLVCSHQATLLGTNIRTKMINLNRMVNENMSAKSSWDEECDEIDKLIKMIDSSINDIDRFIEE